MFPCKSFVIVVLAPWKIMTLSTPKQTSFLATSNYMPKPQMTQGYS